jgi:asparagine synthase (glutamine-hydrolysing)
MCGIAGIVNPPTATAGERMAEAMAAAIVHRGPDEGGGLCEDRVALATRRLSIIDLARGHQPMTSGGVSIVYNGEVYNYLSVRADLEREGVEFETASDTEVVLEAYRAWGLDFLDRLEGMFALCIYDAEAGEIHLARDRLGKKPLYWWRRGSELRFASEIKALLATDVPREINLQAVHDYLTLRYVPGPETIWRGIHKLEPGRRLRFRLADGELEIAPWWRLEFAAERAEPGRDYEGEFERLLLAAVEKRLLAADVPVGMLLSGGIDSSAVAAAAVELGHRDFHTFSVGFAGGDEWSELPYASRLAEHIGSRHHEVVVDVDDFVGFLPELVRSTDEPLADLAAVPLHYVSRLAREEVKVVLSGEGADEVLGGYNLEQTASEFERWRRIARVVPRPALAAAGALAPRGRGERATVVGRTGWSGLARGLGIHMTRVFDEGAKAELWREPADVRPTSVLIDEWYAQARSEHPLDQLQEVYCPSWMVEDLLMKADKMSMRNSLELRVPFLDHVLVEWAARAPLHVKFGSGADGWRSKRVLRDFAAERVPREIVARPKRGFPVPAYEWLSGPLRTWMSERLAREPGPLGDLFDPAALRPVAGAAAAGEIGAAHQAWALLVLQEWLEVWT